PHQIRRRQRRARCLQPQARKRLKDDVRKGLEVVEQQRKEPDVEHLADELRRQVVFTQPRPEQTRQRDVDRNEHACQERHVARQQAKAAANVATERLRKPIEDGQVVHARLEAPGKAPPYPATGLPPLSVLEDQSLVMLSWDWSLRERGSCRNPARRTTFGPTTF